jgi:CBS domain-containing protein
MKIRDMMTGNPVCCVPTESAQRVARLMCDESVGTIPAVMDPESRKLVGVITESDLCCSVLANGLDAKATPIEKFMTLNPVTCREAENVENCERLMQQHQSRRIPIEDAHDRVI